MAVAPADKVRRLPALPVDLENNRLAARIAHLVAPYDQPVPDTRLHRPSSSWTLPSCLDRASDHRAERPGLDELRATGCGRGVASAAGRDLCHVFASLPKSKFEFSDCSSFAEEDGKEGHQLFGYTLDRLRSCNPALPPFLGVEVRPVGKVGGAPTPGALMVGFESGFQQRRQESCLGGATVDSPTTLTNLLQIYHAGNKASSAGSTSRAISTQRQSRSPLAAAVTGSVPLEHWQLPSSRSMPVAWMAVERSHGAADHFSRPQPARVTFPSKGELDIDENGLLDLGDRPASSPGLPGRLDCQQRDDRVPLGSSGDSLVLGRGAGGKEPDLVLSAVSQHIQPSPTRDEAPGGVQVLDVGALEKRFAVVTAHRSQLRAAWVPEIPSSPQRLPVGQTSVSASRLMVAFRFLYRAARRALDLLVLCFRAADDKDVEILVLRHQLTVMNRQVGKPRFDDADRTRRHHEATRGGAGGIGCSGARRLQGWVIQRRSTTSTSVSSSSFTSPLSLASTSTEIRPVTIRLPLVASSAQDLKVGDIA